MYLLASKLKYLSSPYLAGHFVALAAGLSDSILPDPLAAKDLVRAEPREIAELVRHRIYEDRLPTRRAILRYPKNSDPSSYRTVTSLDILDQYAYRQIVSPLATVSARLLPESVLSMRPTCDQNGVWYLGDSRAAWKVRQERILYELEARPDPHLVVMDVRQYYPSLSPGPLAVAMNSFGLNAGAAGDIIRYLDALNGLPGTVGGLPIGP